MCFPVLMCVPGRRGRCEAIDEVGSNFGSSDANGRVNFWTHLDTFTSFIHLHTPSYTFIIFISHSPCITRYPFHLHHEGNLHISPSLLISQFIHFIHFIFVFTSFRDPSHLWGPSARRCLVLRRGRAVGGTSCGTCGIRTFLVKSLAARLLVSLPQANSIGLPRASRFADFPEFRICLSMKHSATFSVWISV